MEINILVIVDTKTTLAGNTTVYMTDDNPGYDQGEGTAQLVVNAKPGDVIIWRAMSIDPSQTVSLDEFIDKDGFNIFCGNGPSKIGEVWTGVVDNYPPGTEESYTFVFSINGAGKYDWDPKIQIQPDSD